jgi:hypothetical protein
MHLNLMKRFAIISFLAFLAVGCQTPAPQPYPSPLPPNNTPSSPPTPTPQTPTSSTTPETKNTYQSSRFGFRFQYPDQFTVDTRSEAKPTEAQEFLLGELRVWKSEDYQAIVSGTWKANEYPASIIIWVFDNTAKRPLTAWKDSSLSRGADQNTTVAGQPAISYASDGLYSADNVIFASPDGRYVIHIQGAYISADDSRRQAFQRVVSSFTFQS